MLTRFAALRLSPLRNNIATPARRSLAAKTSPSRNAKARAPFRQLQSSNSTLLVSAAVLCVTGSGAYYLHSRSSKHVPPSQLPASEDYDVDASMSAQVAPGRPGNLTVDQEVKLQDLWKATLKVFGVELGQVRGMSDQINGSLESEAAEAAEADEAEEEEEDAKADAKDADKDKKKKKRSFFGRKKKDKDEKDVKDTKDTKAHKKPVAADMPSAADDKYGQTKEYLEALEKNPPEEIRNAFWRMVKADHPDALLLRFLRARKWDIEKALVMMISTLNWRLNEMHVDEDIMAKGEEHALENSKSSEAALKKSGEDFLTQLRLGKSYLHGTDKEGRPMCIVRTRLHRAGEQSEASVERFTVYLIETARLVLVSPADTAAIVFDMTDFSLANMDYAPVKFMIKCFEANYPESLGVVLVHKAPWLFQGIWKIIRGWLDPVVAGKVHFTNNVDELEVYIARDKIPKELGGKEDYEYKYPEPVEGENKMMQDTATRERLQEERQAAAREFENVTLDWIKGPPGEMSVKALRNAAAEKLRRNYWQLDPYVRARSLHDRLGVISEGGLISPYSVQKGTGSAPDVPDGGPSSLEPPTTNLSLRPSSLRQTESETASKPGSRSGPVPAGHEENGVD